MLFFGIASGPAPDIGTDATATPIDVLTAVAGRRSEIMGSRGR